MLKSSKKGFTLIELLVVIAIIAILAAILFPVFAKARGKARQAACMSNVKQLALGIIMYAEDYDGTYPRTKGVMPGLVNGGDNYWGDDCMADWQVFYYGGYQNSLWCWQDFIYPYTKSMKVAYCPDGGGAWSPSGSFGGVAQGQYGANIFIVGSEDSNFAEIQAGIKTDAAVKDPASKYMVMDWGCYYAYAYECYRPMGSSFLPGAGKIADIKAANLNQDPDHQVGNARGNPDSGSMSDFVNGRHSGGVCIGYADGHAKFQTVEKVVQGAYNWAGNLINRRSPVAGYVEKPDPWSPEFSTNSD